ncbi:AAA family ATPase [Halomonas sp. AOP23-I1-17]|uniref:AAA family ATPase n=1 Tax=Halomonas sp. AOP23-I1-17 TaxID=3457713 RepID=UPI00403323A4
MTLPSGMVSAVYQETGVPSYQGNPFIEALPPILERKQLRDGLGGSIELRPADIYLDGETRIHIISHLLDGFFQPLARHVELESKISIMLRQGYVGRNLATGDLSTHIQNGYERIMQGNLSAFRFDHVESTAKSLAFIGCSGSGKTSSLNRILATYPQLIHHPEHNFTQIVFLKIDCPHDGSLKSLCHNFFREIDSVLATNYVKRYAEKRHGVETLIAVMSHLANTHAIGLLVIDEIQHLSIRASGGAEKMLNFFVTLVNEISIPVVMVGTPKARPIFEMDLRSARRGAGFGSILWEPMEKPALDENVLRTEWGAFTNKLWKYQWLTKASEEVADELRDLWFDLSQGIMDVVIKLFVLSQIRAVVTGTERITANILKAVYQDELKPIHPMMEALRSGDPSKIARYSDLTIPDIDKKILELSNLLESSKEQIQKSVRYGGNDQAIRLHNMLVDMGYESDLLAPLIERAFEQHPDLQIKDLMPIILSWYQSSEQSPQARKQRKPKSIKAKDWHTLDSDDLRFMHSQAANEEQMLKAAQQSGLVFNTDRWLTSGE